jgi:hypothetical protein
MRINVHHSLFIVVSLFHGCHNWVIPNVKYDYASSALNEGGHSDALVTMLTDLLQFQKWLLGSRA